MQKTYSLLLLISLMFIFGCWSVSLGQDANWDLHNYHFYNAYAFLYHRMGWDIAPAMLQTYINPFLDITNYALIVSQKPIMTGFILGTLSGISAFILYQTALILFSDITSNVKLKHFYASLAVLIGATGCASISQLGTTSNENKIALLIILSFYFILRAITLIKPHKHIALAGACMGLAVGFKLTAATYGLGLFMGLLFYRRVHREQLVQLCLFSTLFLMGFLIADGYWLWKMAHVFQNPLFPYYNNIFHSPYVNFESFAGTAFKPQDWLHYIFLPFYLIKNNSLTIESFMRDYRFAAVYCLAILWIKKTSNAWNFVFITFLISYLTWLIQFATYRYAIPLEYYAGLTIVYGMQLLIRQRVIQIISLSVVTFLILASTQYPHWATRVKFEDAYFIVPAPTLPNNSMVLLIYEPLAYVVPFFHSTSAVQFIGADNNLTYPTKRTGLQKIINQTILLHHGPVFTLTYPEDNNRAKKDLQYYHLTPLTSQCQTIKTNQNEQLILCPTKRK